MECVVCFEKCKTRRVCCCKSLCYDCDRCWELEQGKRICLYCKKDVRGPVRTWLRQTWSFMKSTCSPYMKRFTGWLS